MAEILATLKLGTRTKITARLMSTAHQQTTDVARRLGKARLADRFLLCEHPLFARQMQEACALAHERPSPARTKRLEQLVHEAIEPFNIAGLKDRSRHPWYPALPGDLANSARKLEASEDEIRAMFKKYRLQ